MRHNSETEILDGIYESRSRKRSRGDRVPSPVRVALAAVILLLGATALVHAVCILADGVGYKGSEGGFPHRSARGETFLFSQAVYREEGWSIIPVRGRLKDPELDLICPEKGVIEYCI